MFSFNSTIRRLAVATRRSRVQNHKRAFVDEYPVGSEGLTRKAEPGTVWADRTPPTSGIFAELDEVMSSLSTYTGPQSAAQYMELVRAMELADRARCRVPLRDLAAMVLPYLSASNSSAETLSLTVRALSCTGRGMVYFQEFFDYLVKHKDSLSPGDLSVVIYECGRHGLRSKHYLDSLVKEVPAQLGGMDREAVSRCLKGICKFAGDYRPFANALVKRTSFGNLSPGEVLVLLRVLRQIGDTESFTQLIRKMDVSSFSLVDKLGSIYLLKRSRNFALDSHQRRTAAAVTESLVKSVSGAKLDGVSTTDLTDCLDALASWKIRDESFLGNIMTVVSERVAEIKYSPICGLWQSVTDSLGHLSFFDAKWMRTVDELASSEFNLRSFAAFQLVFFTSSLGRLNYFNQDTFRAIASVVTPDVASINDADMLATLMFPLERAGFQCPDLVDAVLHQTAKIAARPSQTTSRGQFRGVLTATYACVSLGAPVSDPRMAVIIDFLFSQKSYSCMNPQDFIRLRRLDAVGLFPRGLPEILRGSPDFVFWSHSPARQQVIGEYLEKGAERVDGVPFVDLKLQDGTMVVVPDPEPQMRQWKHPKDFRSYDLVPLESNGTRDFVSRFLMSRGHRLVFASPA